MQTRSFSRIGNIDIGSNSIKYKEFSYSNKSKKIKLIKTKRINIRLGRDVFKFKRIRNKTKNNLYKAMKIMSEDISENNLQYFDVVATSAIRDSKNRKAICKQIKKIFSTECRVLSGKDEAKLLSYASYSHDIKNCLLVDVGGGSTELYFTDEKGVEYLESFNIGSVRIKQNRDKDKEWIALSDFIKNIGIENIKSVVGIGGNIREIVNGINSNIELQSVSLKDLKDFVNKFSYCSNKKRISNYNFSEYRVDVAEYTAKIFIYIMKQVPHSRLKLLKYSISEGSVLDSISNQKKKSELKISVA